MPHFSGKTALFDDSNLGALIMFIVGFKGDSCEINNNECDFGFCTNNSTCIDLPGDYTCICPQGFTGRHYPGTGLLMLFLCDDYIYFQPYAWFKVRIHLRCIYIAIV